MEHLGKITFEYIRQYGYFAMLPLMVVEGSAATIVAAVLASLGAFFWPIVLIFSILGDLIGNVILYWVGYRWGMKFAQGWGRYVGINEKRVLKMEKYFQRHGGKTLFVVKSMTGIYALAFITAGVVRMDFRKFLRYSLLGAVAWSSFLVAMGYSYGYLWKSFKEYLNWAGFIILLVTIFSLLAISYFKKKQEKNFLEQ